MTTEPDADIGSAEQGTRGDDDQSEATGAGALRIITAAALVIVSADIAAHPARITVDRRRLAQLHDQFERYFPGMIDECRALLSAPQA